MTANFTKTFENLHRQKFRRTINKVWNMIKEGLPADLNQEEKRLLPIIQEHQEYREYFENEDFLDGSEDQMEEGINPFLHISLHQMVEDQLNSKTPVEAARLYEYIEKQGYSRHDAIHVVIMVLIHMIYNAIEKNSSFDEKRYIRLLGKCRKVAPSEMQSVVEREFSSN